jgi:aminopeptidase S
VTVVDQEAPVITCPADVTGAATSGAGAVVTYATPAATDACGAVVSCSPVSGSTFPIGVTTVTCTATDAASNTASCPFTVTVDLVSNGGFEAGVSPWVQKLAGLINNSAAQAARTGTWKAQLLGTGVTNNHWIYQAVPFPSGSGDRTLQFYLKIVSSEGTVADNDRIGVRIFNSANKEIAVLQMFTNQDQVAYADYQLVTVTIPAQYAVPGNRVRFGGSENNSLPTLFLIDDVSLY